MTSNLEGLTKEECEPLTVTQIKRIRSLFDKAVEKNNEALQRHADERDGVLPKIANWVHDSVPVSRTRTRKNRTERMHGNVAGRKKYSHATSST